MDANGRSWHVHHDFVALHPGIGVPLTTTVVFTSGDEQLSIQTEETGPLSADEYRHLFVLALRRDRAEAEGETR